MNRKHTSASHTVSSEFPRPSASMPGLSPAYIKAASALPDKRVRDRIAFGIKPQPKSQFLSTVGPYEEKPRIVMKIKNGKVTTIEKSPNGKSKIVKDTEKKSVLVPYGDDSDSASDYEPSIKTSRKEQESSKVNLNVNNNSQASGRKYQDDSTVIFDKKLNTTTSVPGINTNLLDCKNGDVKHRRQLDGLNLMISKSKDNKLHEKGSGKKSGDSPLSPPPNVNISGLGKVNSGNKWHVSCQEAAPSPSIGSVSSQDSVNSTSEWHVKDNKEVHQYTKVPERQFSGWKVVPENDELDDDEKTAHDKDTSCSSLSSTSPDERGQDMSQVNIGRSSHERHKSSSPAGDWQHTAQDNNFTVDMSDKQSLLSHDTSSNSSGEKSYSKKHKKHKKHKKENRDTNHKYHELVNESDSRSSSKKHKKKKKRKRYEDEDEDEKRKRKQDYDDPGEIKKPKHNSDHDGYVWVEKTKDSYQPKHFKDKPSGIRMFDISGYCRTGFICPFITG